MATLKAGTLAPDFTLPTMEGKKFSLRDALARGPVLAAFFKVSCPTCQYAFPFLERIYKTYGNKNVTIVGVSQNEKKDTVSFIKEYALTNVPSIFWIAQDGEIEISSVGWDRQEIEDISRKAAETTGDRAKSIFQPGENVADFRAG